MTHIATQLPDADWGHSRAPALIFGLSLGLILLGLVWRTDIPQPAQDWQGKVETRRGPY